MSSTPRPPRTPDRLRWAVEQLDIRPSAHVLEIGCGGGHAVALLCERPTTGTITAIDRSALQVARARARNAGCIAAGRARIERCALADYEPGRRFDAVLAVNVNAFWTTPSESIPSLGRLLRRGGRAYLVYEPPSERRANELRARLPALFEENGFVVEEVRVGRFGSSYGVCFVGSCAAR